VTPGRRHPHNASRINIVAATPIPIMLRNRTIQGAERSLALRINITAAKNVHLEDVVIRGQGSNGHPRNRYRFDNLTGRDVKI